MFGISSVQKTVKMETMLTMVATLRELGGDLSRVNIVGNDFVAIAGESTSSQSAPPVIWEMAPPVCLHHVFQIHHSPALGASSVSGRHSL